MKTNRQELKAEFWISDIKLSAAFVQFSDQNAWVFLFFFFNERPYQGLLYQNCVTVTARELRVRTVINQ